MHIGYGRCSTDKQDLEAQRRAIQDLGVDPGRIYLDYAATGKNRHRPELRKALAAARTGDTFVVTKLDRLARSTRDADDIISGLAAQGINFALGRTVYDWNDPFARMFLQMLSVFAEFEANLISQRTREGMAIAKANGKLRGKQPKLSAPQQKHLVDLYTSGKQNISELAVLFNVSRPAVYRVLDRADAR